MPFLHRVMSHPYPTKGCDLEKKDMPMIMKQEMKYVSITRVNGLCVNCKCLKCALLHFLFFFLTAF